MLNIEDGIPIPTDGRRGPGRKSDFRIALELMEVSQSALFPTLTAGQRFIIKDIGRVAGRKFATRTVDGGVRVWRIS